MHLYICITLYTQTIAHIKISNTTSGANRRWTLSLCCYCCLRAGPRMVQLSVTHYNTLQLTATRCNTLQCTATHCSISLCCCCRCGQGLGCCNTLQLTATHNNTLQLTTTLALQHCITLQLMTFFYFCLRAGPQMVQHTAKL